MDTGRLRSFEELRLAAGRWVLEYDKRAFCGNDPAARNAFLAAYVLPKTEEKLFSVNAGKGSELTVILESRLTVSPFDSSDRRRHEFTYHRYVRSYYDDFGNVYGDETLGYHF